ncbi:hypothetical protein C0J52_07343 [Blattella germanica]|nr:hypothetical protein C0J52_07343 [Blattella germanica]
MTALVSSSVQPLTEGSCSDVHVNNKWDRQLRETGSLLSKAGKHSKRKVVEEHVGHIHEAFQISPRESIRQTSVQLNIPPTIVLTVLHKKKCICESTDSNFTK